jgi:hypothetical protein
MWTLMLEILVIISIRVVIIVSMLLRLELMCLLGARAKLAWTLITAHRHYEMVRKTPIY